MANKIIKEMRVREDDGTLSEIYDIGCKAENVILNDGSSVAEISNQQKLLQAQLDNLVLQAGNPEASSAEITQARTNILNALFPTLNGRISLIEKKLGFIEGVGANIDFNDYKTPGKYIITSIANNRPSLKGKNYGESGVLFIEAFRGDNPVNPISYQYGTQIWIPLKANNKKGFALRLFQKHTDNSYLFTEWYIYDTSSIDEILNKIENHGLTRQALDFTYASNKIITTSTDLDTLLDEGNYLIIANESPNIPYKDTAILTNNVFNAGPGSFKWVHQTFSTTGSKRIYSRIIAYKKEGNEYIKHDWIQIPSSVSSNPVLLTGKKIVNFGDSIFGNFSGNVSVSHYMQNICNAECVNAGFGGCRYTNPERDIWGTSYRDRWGAFSMAALAKAVTSNDWTPQEIAINNPEWKDKPSYFNNRYNELRAVDFTKVDYVTIAYGTNDYWWETTLDNSADRYDITTICGALRYSIEEFSKKYPKIKILVGSTLFRYWKTGEEITETSDTKKRGGYTLPELNTKLEEVCKEYHIPFLNAYELMGMNKFNTSQYFEQGDTTHPNSFGREKLGREYAAKLMSI